MKATLPNGTVLEGTPAEIRDALGTPGITEQAPVCIPSAWVVHKDTCASTVAAAKGQFASCDCGVSPPSVSGIASVLVFVRACNGCHGLGSTTAGPCPVHGNAWILATNPATTFYSLAHPDADVTMCPSNFGTASVSPQTTDNPPPNLN